MSLAGKRILLVIGGGIAAYKALELIRRCRERGMTVRCIMTKGAHQFVTPLSVAALAGEKVLTELFSLTDEAEMGHIRLSREADLIVVAPATANLLARMAGGMADDLAATVLLATDKPVLVAPAMNPQMWAHPSTRRNVARLRGDGVHFVGPTPGDMACGETGLGRMAEPPAILAAIERHLAGPSPMPLSGRRAIVTSGPTWEPIDPVRFIANRSSGRQGHAVAQALHELGASVTLISGPVAIPDPPGLQTVHVETAVEMLHACERALPAEIAVFVAAVADWRARAMASHKLKKERGGTPDLMLVENPDILRTIATAREGRRPRLVIGFAAETEGLEKAAEAKLHRKGCDWLVANEVGADTGTFGGHSNEVVLFRRGQAAERWPKMSKEHVARRLVAEIVRAMDER